MSGDIVEALVIRPGMKLVVRVRSNVTREMIDTFKVELGARLPEVDVVIIACEQILAYDPECGQAQ